MLPAIASICGAPARADDPAPPFSYGAFIDTYAAHDFNDPRTIDRPYTTQPLHEDQLDINLAMIEGKLSTDNYRGRLALQTGNSVEANYASEAHLFWRYIQEASAGVKLTDKLWFDGGIYLAHIGFEGFNSRDNWNYSRSLVADFSPYYETGAKLSYQFDENTTGQLHVLHGWQNISTGAHPALGVQLQHNLTKSVQLTYNNYLGDVHGTRFFNDFIGKADLTDALSVALQFDVGSQQQEGEGGVWWHGFSLMSQYKVSPIVSIGGRVERFSDPHQVVLTTLNGPSFNAVGLSANVDVTVYKGLVWRTEYRAFFGRNAVFPKKDDFSKNDTFVVTSLSYSYQS
jgi:hypothetical protein